MICRFWLLDVSESLWENKACVRFWGINDQNQRIVITADQIPPYFHFLASGDAASTIKRLESNPDQFPDIVRISKETRKLLGKEKTVLRIVCSQSRSSSAYPRLLPKTLGGSSFDDLRMTTRYLTDLSLSNCGWNECEVEPISIENVRADQIYLAKSIPHAARFGAPPHLRVLAFAMLAVGRVGSAIPQRDPIKALAIASDSRDPSLLTPSGDVDSELICTFAQRVNDLDPDVIVGYDTSRSNWPFLIRRAQINNLALTVGRDRSEPHASVFGHISIAGRANLDLADLVSETPDIKARDLKNLATHFGVPTADSLMTRDEWDTHNQWSDSSQRSKLLEETKIAAKASLDLGREAIDYPIELSAITGLPLDQVMAAPTGLRADSYLLRVAHQLGELIPGKSGLPFLAYRGALVQLPKPGVHENVAVLDFASMYPTLMINYNLSPDTLLTPEDTSTDSVFVIPEVGHRFRKRPEGFYKVALESLIEERARTKRELTSADDKAPHRLLRERERAVKLITNACYGYAGWTGGRWYVREVAESAAALGRLLITETIRKASALGLDVIYSDTDSIFVSNVRVKVEELTSFMNKVSGLEVRLQREYIRLLFTEAMKRYAGLRVDGTLDTVGLEAIRGDWSEVARAVQENVLRAVLKDGSIKLAIDSVRDTVRRLRKGEIPLKSCIVRKTLTRPIEGYRVRTPHVEAAKRLIAEGWRVNIGDKVGYVIVKGKGPLFQRARPYHEVRPGELDLEYCVESQIKPAALRILEACGVKEQQLGI